MVPSSVVPCLTQKNLGTIIMTAQTYLPLLTLSALGFAFGSALALAAALAFAFCDLSDVLAGALLASLGSSGLQSDDVCF